MKKVSPIGKSVTVVIPVYNERNNIEPLIGRLTSALAGFASSYQFLFIDDNSTDGTYELLRASIGEHISVYRKGGSPGKAFSLLEGFSRANGDYIVMIDADLQYPPEAIPAMLSALSTADIVVADRIYRKPFGIRKLVSRTFRYVFGRMLFGIHADVQSGLKAFKREVAETIRFVPQAAWAFDLEFLHRAQEAGYRIASHSIVFDARSEGKSKVGILKTSWEIGSRALLLKSTSIEPHIIRPTENNSMIGSGVGHKRMRYITHTTLSHKTSAINTMHTSQKVIMWLLVAILIEGFVIAPMQTLAGVVALLSFVYFVDVLFNLYLILKSLHIPQEIVSTEDELSKLDEQSLPIYTILCPLYREAHVIPQFVRAIDALDWPKDKLDVMLLLEEDDEESVQEVAQMGLPSHVRVVVVPNSAPKTKPKACNYGLSHAAGEYLVVYDAEDIPDPLQLKKAYLGFQKVDQTVLCLQAKLNYYNPGHNLLTRFFTAEYSLWFDLILSGLQSIGTTIPLGGTSNHFKTADLLALEGWDPFNVTEDADLGIRLFKRGYKTAMIDSTTYEEANSRFFNWMRQRSRWLKGYMQTYLVHMREIVPFMRRYGIHGLIFQLVIGGKIAFTLINPLLWAATISYFALYAYVGPMIEALYPAWVFYMAAFSLVCGNFLFIYYYMVGCMRREQYGLIKYVFLIPFYWLMTSIACTIALYQLIFKPHYWEKTIHGFHLQKKSVERVRVTHADATIVAGGSSWSTRVWEMVANRSVHISSGLLVAAAAGASVLNLAFNAYFGRVLDLTHFGILSLVSSFFYIAQIPYTSLSSSVAYRSGFLDGRYKDASPVFFAQWVRGKTAFIAVMLSVVWLLMAPFLMDYFKTDSLEPFVIFAPVWIVMLLAAVDRGYLSGRLMFASLAAVMIAEPVAKLVGAWALVSYVGSSYVYVAIPISVIASYAVSAILASGGRGATQVTARAIHRFPKKFFIAATLSGLSTIAFLSLDIVLVKHFLSPDDAGRYALVALVGKMIFFLISMASQFTLPFISRSQGARTNDALIFKRIVGASLLLGTMGFVAFGVLGSQTIPLLLGSNASSIVGYLPIFTLAMVYFSISRIFITYYQAKKIYSFALGTFVLGVAQIFLISLYHTSILQIVMAMMVVAASNLALVLILHVKINWVIYFERNIGDFLRLLFEKQKEPALSDSARRILMFNWRDTRHAWAGGAEVYVHEIARRWASDGHQVTLFCGNDAHSPRNETIDGVRIIRRGGAYTVYVWAFLYYIKRLRGKFDVIVDSENGIPFFSPLYARIPVVLLIHHVHQEVFREHLPFPLSTIARFMEGRIMPKVYKNSIVITVSESSKNDIIRHHIADASRVEIVNPGIETTKFYVSRKTSHPSFLYLGRLKPYKNVDVIIRAFAQIMRSYPAASLSIVGEGEMLDPLRALSTSLKVDDKVMFYGKIADSDKAILLSQSWALLQPSLLEGWGITVIEANASGTPVIASNVAGLRDSIINGQTGILVEPNNVLAFVKAMKDIIENASKRRSMSKEAYSWSGKFNWNKSAKNFYRIIRDSIVNSVPTPTRYGYSQ